MKVSFCKICPYFFKGFYCEFFGAKAKDVINCDRTGKVKTRYLNKRRERRDKRS